MSRDLRRGRGRRRGKGGGLGSLKLKALVHWRLVKNVVQLELTNSVFAPAGFWPRRPKPEEAH